MTNGTRRFARLGGWCAALATTALLVTACGTIRHSDGAPTLSAGDKVIVASIANFTETPDAGLSAASIATNVLRANGLKDVSAAPADARRNTMFDSGSRDAASVVNAARSQNARFVLSGGVEEWRYKTGVDGEPVVGVTFELTDVASGKVVWSATGSRSGWSRSGLSSVATKLIGNLLSPLAVRR